MKPRGPLMIEHRLIEKMIEIIKQKVKEIQTTGKVDPIFIDEEKLEIVGFSHCGACPGGNIEYVPAEMVKNSAEVIHFATGMVVGYPPCPYINQFKEFIENHYKTPVVIGTHPIPLKYYDAHNRLSFWDSMKIDKIAGHLLEEGIMALYD